MLAKSSSSVHSTEKIVLQGKGGGQNILYIYLACRWKMLNIQECRALWWSFYFAPLEVGPWLPASTAPYDSNRRCCTTVCPARSNLQLKVFFYLFIYKLQKLFWSCILSVKLQMRAHQKPQFIVAILYTYICIVQIETRHRVREY